VQVQIHAAALNRLDVWVRNGWPGIRQEYPHIPGADGGVNLAALQIAKHVGAKVYVVGSNMAKLQRAEELGADELIDRSREVDWAKAVHSLTNKRGVDVVVDNVGAGTLPLSLRAATKGGRILTVGNTGGAKFEFDNRYMFAKHLTYIGSTMGTRTDFVEVMSLIFAGKLRAVVDETFALRDARRAHERLEQGEFFGKIVLQP
jgi:NADPH:quinone reductase-like Zn-dependent oxidoreductase